MLTRLILDVAVGSEPIAGQLRAEGREPARFAGYIQLIQTLEEARGAHRERDQGGLGERPELRVAEEPTTSPRGGVAADGRAHPAGGAG